MSGATTSWRRCSPYRGHGSTTAVVQPCGELLPAVVACERDGLPAARTAGYGPSPSDNLDPESGRPCGLLRGSRSHTFLQYPADTMVCPPLGRQLRMSPT